MTYDLTKFKTEMARIEEWFLGELGGFRTGRASPLLLDAVHVDSYGTRMPIKHVAALAVDDARTLRITPWDKSQMKGIESAIAAANLGVSTAPDSSSIRVIFPELTSERRMLLIKALKEKLEEARVAVRIERDKVWSDIQTKEREGSLSEDEKFRSKDELQKMVDDVNGSLEAHAEKKEKEILS